MTRRRLPSRSSSCCASATCYERMARGGEQLAMANGVLAVIETSAGEIRPSSLEILAPARELAAGGPVAAVVLGSGVLAVAQDIAARGVDRTVVVDAPLLE